MVSWKQNRLLLILYTLGFDASNMENEEAVAADMARRRTQFEGMLVNMKNIAEAR